MQVPSILQANLLIMIGISGLLGATLGLRFNFLILIPTNVLAVISAAIIEVARGDQPRSIALTIVLVATALQIGYLVGSITCATVDGLGQLGKNPDVALDIRKDMEVLGSDSKMSEPSTTQ